MTKRKTTTRKTTTTRIRDQWAVRAAIVAIVIGGFAIFASVNMQTVDEAPYVESITFSR